MKKPTAKEYPKKKPGSKKKMMMKKQDKNMQKNMKHMTSEDC